MEANIKSLVQACQINDIPYQFIDNHQNYMIIAGKHHFHHNRTPFNNQSMAQVCKDKKHQYELLKNKVNMPKTMDFLDYNVKKKYQTYVTYKCLDDIIEQIENNFSYPLVIKKNKGALGIHVFLCQNQDEARVAINTVFDKSLPEYDYVVLAQEFIKTKKEIRVVFYDGKARLSYERYFGDVKFGARYWEGLNGKTIPLLDQTIINKATEVFRQAVTLPGLSYVGLDIIIDENDNFFLIELNSGPKFNNYIFNHGDNAVVAMYSEILKDYLKDECFEYVD